MRYDKINNKLFIDNRKKLTSELVNKSLVVIHSNDQMPISGDGLMDFVQSSDMFYLTGIDQEESILALCPNHPDEHLREVLFLKKTSEIIAIWEGHKYTKEEAMATSGIQSVFWLEDFEFILKNMAYYSSTMYLNTNENLRAMNLVETKDARFIKRMKKQFPLHQYARIAPLLTQLRSVKSKIEIDLMRKACEITRDGFLRILKFVKPGVYEYEIEAEFIHEFTRLKSQGFAYQPIIASGNNANVLHYVDNNCKCNDGDLLLLDVGSRYANYSSDMTRTIPVSGRFTTRQKEVYNAVLDLMKKATLLLKPGITISEYHKKIGALATEALMKLKLISLNDVKNANPIWPAYKKYLMHGTSHFLGIDVHDVGDFHKPIEEGCVFTVEPGFYIPDEGFGIRLEDNIVVKEKGENINLMHDIPLYPDEIEDLMHSK